MAEAEFDQFAKKYQEIHNKNLGQLGESSEYFDEHKVLELKDLLSSLGRENQALTLVDYGRGVGKTYPFLHQHLPNIKYLGVDPSGQSIEQARVLRTNATGFSQLTPTGGIPAADQSADIVFLACVVHHIPPAERVSVFREIHRVLKPGGIVFVVEHNPFNPATQYIVRTCEFDDDAILITKPGLKKLLKQSGFEALQERYVIFLPKKLRQFWPGLEKKLSACPFGAQYWCAFQKR